MLGFVRVARKNEGFVIVVLKNHQILCNISKIIKMRCQKIEKEIKNRHLKKVTPKNRNHENVTQKNRKKNLKKTPKAVRAYVTGRSWEWTPWE